MLNRRQFFQRTGATGNDFDPDLEISMISYRTQIPIFPGSPTRVWSYKGQVLKGDQARLINIDSSYLGPIIRVNRGEKIRINFINDVPDETIVHWHGLHVPAVMDGHPRFVIPQGKEYNYEFEVRNRAGTYWYHPHPHGRTGPQVYRGLAGLFIVSDDEEKAAGLPSGPYDIPLVIQDRLFDASNQLVYSSGNMWDKMDGFLGDRILVNGQPDFNLPVATRAYRLRILNGSNSRIYKLAWQDGTPLTIVGTDGGLLEKPVDRKNVFLSPGERIDLWADFSSYPVGSETSLISLPFDVGMMGNGRMAHGKMGGRVLDNAQVLPNGAGLSILKIKVNRKEKAEFSVPQRLSHIERYNAKDAVNFENPRTFRLSLEEMIWKINGRTFEMEEVADEEVVQLGSLEVWEFSNEGSGTGMRGLSMPHPIHLHGKQFQVLDRSGVLHDGYLDDGWKDTVLLMPEERIRIIVEFEDYSGLFLYHCHNLEHEDMGMMRNYLVKS
jgi:FtsP/CotA-like multicopper oxidase with cupredoxin domain